MDSPKSDDRVSSEFSEDVRRSSLQKQLWIRKLTQTEGCFESPIDISISKAKEITLPPLQWHNFERPPKKMKLTNTGYTIIFSAKWGQERPYLSDGPFLGKYVFSNWHLHWGRNDMEGSEHTIDGVQYPAEMHVVFFKSCYLTQEAALKEQDGCVSIAYIFQLQEEPNPAFQEIVDTLQDVTKAGDSKKMQPSVITNLVRQFTCDYLMYWGSVRTSQCVHYLLWIINRTPIGVSREQIDALRYINNTDGEPLQSNFRNIQELQNRTVFHVCPSNSKYSTLLPIPDNNFVQYRCEVVDTVSSAQVNELHVMNYPQ